MIEAGTPVINVTITMGCGCQIKHKVAWDGLDHDAHIADDLVDGLAHALENHEVISEIQEAEHEEDGPDHMTIVVTRGVMS